MRLVHRAVLGALVLCASIIGCSISSRAEPLPAPARVLPFRAGQPASAKPSAPPASRSEEKKQVPKPPPAPPPESPPSDRDHGDHHRDHHDDSDDGNDCFGSCVGSFFGSIFSSGSSSTPPPPPPPPAPGLVTSESALGWAIGAQAWIRDQGESDTVTLWDQPTADPAARAATGQLPRGSTVAVVETHGTAEGLWVRVRPWNGTEPIGWLGDQELMSAPPAQFVAPPPPPPPPPPAPILPARQRWSVALGGGLCGPGDLNVEYDDGAFRGEAGYARVFGAWTAGVAAGYRGFTGGTPRFLYVGATEVDDPRRSTLEMVDVGLRFGQRLGGAREGVRFYWSLGPSYVRVREWAKIHVLDPNTFDPIGTREEWLVRWRPAGDARIGVGWGRAASPAFAIGLEVGGYVISWDGTRRRSLTSDYLGKRSISGVDFMLGVSFDQP